MPDQRETPKRRPLLAHGERLSKKATRSGMGGEKFHPLSIEKAWENLAPKAEGMVNEVADLRPDVRGRHVVFEATLLPNYLASTYSPADILEKSGLYLVGSRISRERYVTAKKVKEDKQTKTLLLAGNPNRVQSFARMITQRPTPATNKTWERLRQFSDIGLPRADRVIVRRPDLGAGEVITWEAVLTHIFDDPTRERAWADEHFEKWVSYIRSIGGRVDVDYRRDVQHLTFVPVELSGEELEAAAQFNLLRAIRPMPTLRPLPTEVLRMFQGSTRPSRAATEGRIPNLTIAAFDGGVNHNLMLFRPFVTAVDLTSEPPDPHALQHGSLVTSALLYGPIVSGTVLPDPEACVKHYRVLPIPQQAGKHSDAGAYWMLDQIVNTVRRDKHSLVSLSLGPNDPVEEDQEPTRWTAELDVLATEGVTFVTAVGNNGEHDATLGLNRVLAPADMVNGIAVGACSTSDRTNTVRASYSAIGPGREGQRVAPTGVAFGGSDAEPFVGIDPSGRLANTAGTSFAAPSTARAVANLWNALSVERRTPAHSRAFAVHFATKRNRGHKYTELGHGLLPSGFAGTFECASNEVTVLYEDDLPRADVVAMQFPFPNNLPSNMEIVTEWTIAFTSAVDPRDASDYALHGLEVVFRPNDARRMLTSVNNKQRLEVDMRVDSALVHSSLAKGYKLGGPLGHSNWRPRAEAELRARGKWDTMVLGRANLQSQDLYKPRLDVLHLRRADGQLVTGDGVPPLRIVMLLTMRAPTGVQLYDRVALAYPVLAPLVQLPIRIPGVA